MKTIQYKNQTYPVRESWHEVPISLLSEIQQTENENTFQYYCKCLGLDYDVFRSFPASAVQRIAQISKWCTEKPLVEPVTSFVLEGVKYTWNGNIFSMTAGQFADCMAFLSQYEGYDAIPYVTACLYWKEDETQYVDVIKVFNERSELFKNLNVVTALSIYDFFLLLCKNSKSITALHSKQTMEILLREIAIFTESTDGSTYTIPLPTMTLLKQAESKILLFQGY